MEQASRVGHHVILSLNDLICKIGGNNASFIWLWEPLLSLLLSLISRSSSIKCLFSYLVTS